MGAGRAGVFLGVYMAAWAYAEVVLLAAAVGGLGLEPRVAAGLLGLAGLASSGLGLLYISRLGLQRVAPLLAPLPALVYAALLAGGGVWLLAPAYPLMAVATAIVASVAVGYVLDTSNPDSWPWAVVRMRVALSLSRGAVMAGILAAGAPLAPALAGLAGVAVVYSVATAPLVVPMRRLYRLSLLIDDLYWAIATGRPRPGPPGLAAYLAAALAGAGLAAGARYQLAPLIGGLDHEGRLYALALYSLAYAAGAAAAALAPGLAAAAAGGLVAAWGHAYLDPVAAHAVAGAALGYAETAVAVHALRSQPTAAGSITAAALVAAGLGVLAYSVSPTPALPAAASAAASALIAWASSRRRWE